MKRLLLVLLLLLCLMPASLAEDSLCVTIACTEEAPAIDMYTAPSDGSPVIARFFGHVSLSVLDRGSGYVLADCGGLQGWLKETDLLAENDGAFAYDETGTPARVWDVGAVRYQPVYRATSDDAPFASLEAGLALRVLAMTEDDAWLLVLLPDSTTGFVPVTALRREKDWQMYVMGSNTTLRLNLRAAPTKDSTVLGRYYSGAVANRLFCGTGHGEWTHVVIGGVAGYMKTEYLVPADDTDIFEAWPPAAALRSPLNLRQLPDKTSQLVGQYNPGDGVEILGTTGMWAHVAAKDGQYGYMLLEGLGGEPQFSDLSERSIRTACTVTDGEGNIIGSLYPGDKPEVIGSRPRSSWRYTENGMQLIYPDKILVQSGTLRGYVPAEAVEIGW
ncbi:MAG: SH3 domain-containing protein [Clostridia bacterium]|nr:SH3 domain-containing protein [Clostridia bacterium]